MEMTYGYENSTYSNHRGLGRKITEIMLAAGARRNGEYAVSLEGYCVAPLVGHADQRCCPKQNVDHSLRLGR
jgi:hypothetical protein